MKAKPQDPRFTRHARERWNKGDLFPRRDLNVDVTMRRAWEESFPIEIPPHWPYGPNLTLHPPSRTIFVWGPDDQNKYGYAVTTVLNLDTAERKHGNLTNNPIGVCPDCRYRYNVEQNRECPWCARGY